MLQRARQHWIRVLIASAMALLCVLPATADLKYVLVSRDVVMKRLADAPVQNSDRVVELEKMFREAGCQTTEEPVKHLHQPNVLCVLPGSTASMIVVGAHLDHVEEGTGVIDDWSGASMLPSLYQGLASHPRTHTFLFIGFAGEEDGMVGSEFYVKHLAPEDRNRIAAMVNLECLGVTSTKVWATHSDPQLLRDLIAMAQSLKLPLSGVNMERVGTTDSESFSRYKIPRITIHSITQATLSLLHSKGDNINAIEPNFYYDSYRMIAPYLVLLDQQLPTDGSDIEKKIK
jgi:hypothetical protein